MKLRPEADKAESSDSLSQSQSSINEGRIYVFTPEGHVVDLPVGATPLDFAYYVHTVLVIAVAVPKLTVELRR